MNRVQLADECTKYFHAMATISYRKNVITQLHDNACNLVTDHASKAALIWSAFKNRMGITAQPLMNFDLANLITPQDLSNLVFPFSRQEIDLVIKSIPTDKAPGPDSF